MSERFDRFAETVSGATGSPWAFLLAGGVVVLWAVTGPFLHFSEGWQLTINTGTTIVTFLMVFAIQADQNRTSRALHLKLDELLYSHQEASDELIDAEHHTAEALEQQKARLTEVHA